MTTIATIAGGVLLILAVIALAYLAGRGKGGSDQRAGNAQATADIRAREQEAAARAPQDKAAVIDELRKGGL